MESKTVLTVDEILRKQGRQSVVTLTDESELESDLPAMYLDHDSVTIRNPGDELQVGDRVEMTLRKL